MERNDNEKKSFKEYLDSITNLLTVFGIFNALFIFSGTVEDDTAASFLLPTFFVLSMFIWYELIVYSLKYIDTSKKFEFFSLFLGFIGIGMVWYFIVKFKPLIMLLSVQFSLYLLVGILAYILFKVTSLIFKRKLSLRNDGKNRTIKFSIFLISLIISGVILKFNAIHIVKLLEKIIPETQKTEIKKK